MTRPWLSVIGLGPEGEAGLTAGALAALGEATHVVCAERHAGLLPEALLAGKTIINSEITTIIVLWIVNQQQVRALIRA